MKFATKSYQGSKLNELIRFKIDVNSDINAYFSIKTYLTPIKLHTMKTNNKNTEMANEKNETQLFVGELLTTAEVQEKLKCSRPFVYGLRKSGRLMAIKAGYRKVLFSSEDVNRFLMTSKEVVNNG